MVRAFAAVLAFTALMGQAQAADKVKIGFLSTLSGPSAALAIDIRDGFNLFVQTNGGKLGGIPVEMTYGDDQQNPHTPKQLTEKQPKRPRANPAPPLPPTPAKPARASWRPTPARRVRF